MRSKFQRSATLVCQCLGLAILAHAGPGASSVSAQQLSSKSSLINQQAASRVEQLFSGRRRSEQTQRVVSRYSGRSEDLVHKLNLDSVDSILMKNRRETDLFSTYRGMAYLSYVRDVVNVEELLEFDSSAAAQKVLLYEGLRLSNEHIFKPLIGHWYDEIVAKLRLVRDYTTVGVVQDDSGDIGVKRGLSEDEPLVEFRMHASARYGLEPRLRFDENLMLRYRPLEQETMLEFTVDF